MAFTDLIKPGDKIDIRLLQQVENEERTGDTVKVYKSQVLDINKRGNLEISMPTEGTKLILLPLDVRLEFVFYSGGFLYKSIGQIVGTYRRYQGIAGTKCKDAANHRYDVQKVWCRCK